MKFNALIVDDEHSGRIAIKILLEKEFSNIFENVTLSAKLEDAKEQVKNNPFDVCFLDIELNNKSGFELLPFLDKKTKVIFVTAYSEYAIKALREKAYDYLLKPVNPIEFSSCVKRFESENISSSGKQFLMIKDQGYNLPVLLADICYIEGNGPYSKLFLLNGTTYTITKTLKDLSESLGQNFIRIHKSYIVNKAIVHTYKKNNLITNTDICLPVSRSGSKLLSVHF